jgi:hypothetical protein
MNKQSVYKIWGTSSHAFQKNKTIITNANKHNVKTEYGKNDFALKVVKANQDGINSKKFEDVLDLIVEIMDDYKK